MGLKTLLMLKQQETIKAFIGKLTWQDDFDKMKFDYYSGRLQRLDRLF
jgi:hypothetical protein